MTIHQIFFRLHRPNRGAWKREGGHQRMSSSTSPTLHTQNPNPLPIVVLMIGTVTGKPTHLPATPTDLPLKNSGPVQKDFMKTIVRTANVDYYYCIFVGNRATFRQGLLPGFFYPFFKLSDTVIRHSFLFSQTTPRVSTIASLFT